MCAGGEDYVCPSIGQSVNKYSQVSAKSRASLVGTAVSWVGLGLEMRAEWGLLSPHCMSGSSPPFSYF